MSAELILAIPPTMDLCWKYFKELRQLCYLLKSSGTAISECLLRIDNGRVRVEQQFKFLERVQHLMKDEHREVYEMSLSVLSGKLKVLTSLLQGLVRVQINHTDDAAECTYRPRKLKYAFQKESLDRAVEEFETWQRIADPSWFLLMKIADAQIDAALTQENSTVAATIPSTVAIRSGLCRETSSVLNKSGLSLDSGEIQKMKISPISHCHAVVAARSNASGGTSCFILDKVDSSSCSSCQIVRKDVRDLTRKLQHDEPETFGILACKGFMRERSEPEPLVIFTLVFKVPATYSNPQSLRASLVDSEASTSLTFRLSIAKSLANAVSYVHTFGFIHKNVRPESVISFNTGSGAQSPITYLVGFENFRRDQGQTLRLGDNAFERNLYRHPSRQGPRPQEDYAMQHDIYSLGVCLLEIGFWKSFVDYDAKDGAACASLALRLPSDIGSPQITTYLQAQGREHLLSLARSHLPQLMGDRYTEVVETCLTCLEPDNEDFGDQKEFQDEDGILVGARYIEKVILRLNDINV